MTTTSKGITPLPWEVQSMRRISALRDSEVAFCVQNRSALTGKVIDRTEAEINAAYIVQACNAFPQMVEALETALAFCQSFSDVDEGRPDGTIQKIQAALQIAEGRPPIV